MKKLILFFTFSFFCPVVSAQQEDFLQVWLEAAEDINEYIFRFKNNEKIAIEHLNISLEQLKTKRRKHRKEYQNLYQSYENIADWLNFYDYKIDRLSDTLLFVFGESQFHVLPYPKHIYVRSKNINQHFVYDHFKGKFKPVTPPDMEDMRNEENEEYTLLYDGDVDGFWKLFQKYGTPIGVGQRAFRIVFEEGKIVYPSLLIIYNDLTMGRIDAYRKTVLQPILESKK